MPVEVGIGWPLDVQGATADVIDGLVVHHEGTVGVLQSGVGGQDGVVGLDHCSGNLGCRVDGELKLALLAIVHGQPLHEKGGKSRSSAAAEGMEEKESLESSASICQLPDSVKNKVGNLLSVDELLRVVQLTVCSASGLVNYSGLQIDEDC